MMNSSNTCEGIITTVTFVMLTVRLGIQQRTISELLFCIYNLYCIFVLYICMCIGFNHYYNTYDDLRIHYRKEHFLCEEEHCAEEKFTSVFRTDIDLKGELFHSSAIAISCQNSNRSF